MTVLVTGAASGIGAATVRRLLALGNEVVGLDILEMKESEGFIPFALDITDADAVSKIRDELSLRGITLDAIVLAAGVHRMASLVEGDLAQMRRVVEVNLIGAMTVSRILFSRLSSYGRIVIITSEVAPLDPLAFNGLYSMSKTALDSYAQALRQELCLIGIKVVTVRPGAVETPLCASSLSATAKLADETVLYKRQAGRFLGIVKKFMGKPMSADKFAITVVRAVTTRRPRITYSKNRSLGLVLLSALPKRAQCAVIKLLLNS